jgi:hypothetical protein
MLDAQYLEGAIHSFERRHEGKKPAEIVVGLTAALVLANREMLVPSCLGVPVVTRPLHEAEVPLDPGKGRRILVSHQGSELVVAELA